MPRTRAAGRDAAAKHVPPALPLVGAAVPEQRGRSCPIDGGSLEHRYETAGIPWFRCTDCGSEMPGSAWQY